MDDQADLLGFNWLFSLKTVLSKSSHFLHLDWKPSVLFILFFSLSYFSVSSAYFSDIYWNRAVIFSSRAEASSSL